MLGSTICFFFADEEDEDDVDVDGDDVGDEKSRGGSSRRKSVGDSPLDALFQMASKTFEGLKAKSGKLLMQFIHRTFDENKCRSNIFYIHLFWKPII